MVALESVAAGSTGPPIVIGDPRGDLAQARQESEWVADHVGVEAYTGAQATRHTIAQASASRLLHIAGHTWLAPGGPWLGLADGRVAASLVVHDRIRPQVAVLASCSGAATRGGGYWGSWGAAFLAAGTPSVVAALWSVGDA